MHGQLMYILYPYWCLLQDVSELSQSDTSPQFRLWVLLPLELYVSMGVNWPCVVLAEPEREDQLAVSR